MKNLELTDKEICTLLHAVGNELNRTFARRCAEGKDSVGDAEKSLLGMQDKLYKLLMDI